MAKKQKETVKTKNVKCDGGNGALGHPAVFLNMGSNDNIECPYCGKLFVIKKLKK